MLKDGFPFESWMGWVHSPVTTEDSCVFRLGESQWKHLYVPENCNLSWGVDPRKGDKNRGGLVRSTSQIMLRSFACWALWCFRCSSPASSTCRRKGANRMIPRTRTSCNRNPRGHIFAAKIPCGKFWVMGVSKFENPPWKPFRSQYPIWVYHHVSKMITTTTIFPHH